MRVVSINVGRTSLALRSGRPYSTSINKSPVPAPVQLTANGFEGDHQSDLKYHGGHDQTACCYPYEHYAHWRQFTGAEFPVPSFGENLTTEGLLEVHVCIGDIFRVGPATLQVTSPRQPCWKLANKHQMPRLPDWINQLGYSGFYLRVLEEGFLTAGDHIQLMERPSPEFTVVLALRAMLDDQPDQDVLAALSTLPTLSKSWRTRLSRKLAKLSGSGEEIPDE